MTDESANGTRIGEEKRIAHTGALARCAGHCARHPWRVVFTWLGIFVALIGLNAAFHGTLVNDFKVPGTDFQKATDLINAKFGGQKGAALRVVVAAPAGPAPRLAERPGRDREDAGRRPGRRRRSLDETKADVSTITNPLGRGRASALEGRAGSRSSTSSSTRPGSSCRAPDVVELEDQLRAIGAPAGIAGRVHRRRRERAARRRA